MRVTKEKAIRTLILAALCGFFAGAHAEEAPAQSSPSGISGVGLMLREEGSNIVVNGIVEDSPAARQDVIRKGDRILSVTQSNGSAVLLQGGKGALSRAVALIRGPNGTAVTLTFAAPGKDDSQAQSVTLVRGDLKIRLAGGRLLANGTKAPDIEWAVLTNRSTGRLSDHAGKIVVLEFWASWCPPCQVSMANLQLMPVRYPDWKDKVALIAASVDDTADVAAGHVAAKGWNQTQNVWLSAKDFRAYHIGGIPAAYVIDEKGLVIFSGAGNEVTNVSNVVNRQLAASQK